MNWTRFSKLTYTREVHDVVMALGLEIPSEGWPRSFLSRSGSRVFSVHRRGPDNWLVGWQSGCHLSSEFLTTAQTRTMASAQFLTKGTPTGDALRYWLNLWEEEPQ